MSPLTQRPIPGNHYETVLETARVALQVRAQDACNRQNARDESSQAERDDLIRQEEQHRRGSKR